MRVSEEDYVLLVAAGALRPAQQGLREARDLLLSIDHPVAKDVTEACRTAHVAAVLLMEEIMRTTPTDGTSSGTVPPRTRRTEEDVHG